MAVKNGYAAYAAYAKQENNFFFIIEFSHKFSMSITLRPYQLECLEAIASNRSAGICRQVIHLPTAAGKTVIFAALIAKEIEVNSSMRALVLAFSTDLLRQARDKLHMINPGIDVGIVDSDHKEFDRKIVLSSIQSARQPANLERLQTQGFSICIADECHHFASDTARFVLHELGFSKDGCEIGGRLLVGFSATPFRQDFRGLALDFDKIVYHQSIKQMIESGYLCKPTGCKVVTDIDFSKIDTDGGDFSQSALTKIMNTPQINQLVVHSYLEKCAGRKAITFATSIDHAVNLSEYFMRFGVLAEAIHSKLSTEARDVLKKRFKDGDIEMLVNPLMLTEGYDEPSISCVIIARPTKSSGLYTQMAGRGLRLHPNKLDCIILDFSDQTHSLASIKVLLTNDTKKPSIKHQKAIKTAEILGELPLNLNPKLKKAILEFDLLGESFAWQKDLDGCYFIKASGGAVLKIIKHGVDRYDVIFMGSDTVKLISQRLDFEYAFSSAQDFARENPTLFTVSDLNASWRYLPISQKQKSIFNSAGYEAGVDSLSRGQASIIIGNGVLAKQRNRRRSKKFYGSR